MFTPQLCHLPFNMFLSNTNKWTCFSGGTYIHRKARFLERSGFYFGVVGIVYGRFYFCGFKLLIETKSRDESPLIGKVFIGSNWKSKPNISERNFPKFCRYFFFGSKRSKESLLVSFTTEKVLWKMSLIKLSLPVLIFANEP